MSDTTTTPAEAPASQASDATAPAKKAGFTIAESAAKRLKAILEDQKKPNGGLKISVRGGGCSGLTYQMDLADAPGEKDKVFEKDGVKVFIDGKSYLYLSGTELVFEESFMASTFKLKNPNVKAECGCGESFSV